MQPYTLEEKNELIQQAHQFLKYYNQPKTAAHCAAVAHQAGRLATRFHSDPFQAEIAGYLHDVSAVIPTPQRLMYANSHSIPILPEELKAPFILHQKISVVICQQVFGIEDEAILSAVGCHTTLKKGASRMDQIVFLADKIAWDEEGEPPYLPAVLNKLDQSLEAAVWVYLDYLWAQRETIRVVHPWFVEAYHSLGGIQAF